MENVNELIDWSHERLTDAQLQQRIAELTEAQKLGCRRLNVWNNGLTSCAGLEAFRNLEKLALSSNHLTSCAALSSLTALRVLRLSGNELTSCEGLSALTNLEVLRLGSSVLLRGGNRIASLAGLENLIRLRSLDLEGNSTSEIPYFLTKFSQLKTLRLYDTPNLPVLPKFKKYFGLGEPELREFQQYLRDLLDKGVRIVETSLRVVVLGHTGVGKTTLLRNITGHVHDGRATEGVEKHDWKGVQLWDFAGQEGYLCLHRMFIRGSRERTVFVILFDASSGDVAKWSLKVREWLLTAFACSAQQRDEQQANAKLRVWFVGTRASKVSEQKKDEARKALFRAVQDIRSLVGNNNNEDDLEVEGENCPLEQVDCFWVDKATGVNVVKARLEQCASVGRDVAIPDTWKELLRELEQRKTIRLDEDVCRFEGVRDAVRELNALGLVVYEDGLEMVCRSEFAIDLVKCLFLGRMGRARYSPKGAWWFGMTDVWLERKAMGTQLWVKDENKRSEDCYLLNRLSMEAGQVVRESERVLCVGGKHCFELTDEAEMLAWQRPAGTTLSREYLVESFRNRVRQHLPEWQIETFPLNVLKAHHLLLDIGSTETYYSPLLFEQQEPFSERLEKPDETLFIDASKTRLRCTYKLAFSMTALAMDLVMTVFRTLRLAGDEAVHFWHNWEYNWDQRDQQLRDGICGMSVEHADRNVFVFYRNKTLHVYCWGSNAAVIERTFRRALEVAEHRMAQYGDGFLRSMRDNKDVMRKDPQGNDVFVHWYKEAISCVRCSRNCERVPRLCECRMVPTLFKGRVVAVRPVSVGRQRCSVFEGRHEDRRSCFVKVWPGNDEQRWKREEVALAKLAAVEGVVRLIESDDFAVATQWIQGRDLLGVSGIDIRVFLRSMLLILGAIHNVGVFHCDIHARNIMQREGDGLFCLVDFDVSMSEDDHSHVKNKNGPYHWTGPYYPGVPMGTAVYDLMCLARTCEYLILNEERYQSEDDQRNAACQQLNDEALWTLISEMRLGHIATAQDAMNRLQ